MIDKGDETAENLLAMLGANGLAMFLLSNLLMLCSAGLSLFACARRVHGVARNTPANLEVEGIPCVFGHRLHKGQPSAQYVQRLERGAALLQSRNALPLILLGGKGRASMLSEAGCGANYLRHKHAIGAEQMVLEDASRFTLENLRHLRDISQEYDKPLILISNRFHLARIASMAEGLSLDYRLCAAESKLDVDAGYLLQLFRDSYMLHWYLVSRRWGALTGNRTIEQWVS